MQHLLLPSMFFPFTAFLGPKKSPWAFSTFKAESRSMVDKSPTWPTRTNQLFARLVVVKIFHHPMIHQGIIGRVYPPNIVVFLGFLGIIYLITYKYPHSPLGILGDYNL